MFFRIKMSRLRLITILCGISSHTLYGVIISEYTSTSDISEPSYNSELASQERLSQLVSDLPGICPLLIDERYQLLNTIRQMRLASIMGGINYAMSLEEMKKTVYDTFMQLRRQKRIFSREEFLLVQNDYVITSHLERDQKDLTQLWGAMYLKKELQASPYLTTYYDVPEYIIVVDDLSHVQLLLTFLGDTYPMVSIIQNGTLYRKKIDGTMPEFSLTCSSREDVDKEGPKTIGDIDRDIGTSTNILFRVTSSEKNILKDSTRNVHYIVRTALENFEFTFTPEQTNVLDYAAALFRYLYNVQEESLTFDLTSD